MVAVRFIKMRARLMGVEIERWCLARVEANTMPAHPIASCLCTHHTSHITHLLSLVSFMVLYYGAVTVLLAAVVTEAVGNSGSIFSFKSSNVP